MLNKLKNLSTVFHLLIIAMFGLSLNGCGYKSSPYYEDKAPVGDENANFTIKAPSK
jgi:predicted small lipoprotein YifL